MHKQRLYLVSHIEGSCMLLTPRSPDISFPSTSCAEHGLAKEEIHILCRSSCRTESNFVFEDTRSRNTDFWYICEISFLNIVLIEIDQDPRTPIPQAYGSSPEVDYFRAPIQRRQQASRWKEDWEELELLVRVIIHRSTWCQSSHLMDGRVAARSAPWSKHATKLTLESTRVR